MTNSYNYNQLDAPISQIYFWNKTLHVSDSSSVHHREFLNVHSAMVYVIQVLLTACEQDEDPDPDPDPARILISQIYFWYKTLHVSDSSSVNHQEFFLL